MTDTRPLSYGAKIVQYQLQAEELLQAVKSGDSAAEWRVKWEHPLFRGKSIEEVRAAALNILDAQAIVARTYGFEDWDDLKQFSETIQLGGPVERFEAAVEAVISGDAETLRRMLREHPELVHARSVRRHHATLLHYVAANGVEGSRQKTPPNAVEIADILLEAGAEVDALAGMYDHRCTTMSMLVSSSHPHEAGLQAALAEKLLDYGAALEGPGSDWQSAVITALQFGYLKTAEALASRGAPVADLPTAAGLGRTEDTARLLPEANADSRHSALALAAQHGQTEVVQLLLDMGEDPDRFNPDGFHAHATPLHHAALNGHLETVRLLAERGARLDIEDTIYQSTPLGWAEHGGQTEVYEYLRSRREKSTQ